MKNTFGSLLAFGVILIITFSLNGCSKTSNPSHSEKQMVITLKDDSAAVVLETIHKIALARGLKQISVVEISKGPLIYQDPDNPDQEISVIKTGNNIMIHCQSLTPSIAQSSVILNPFFDMQKLDEHFNVLIETK